ncbi:uncharacterized protein BJX67DRAFT_379672 [Aspergillus lucknowensis]|uniref:Uncharacterized protein n=1 Tax=Aspergillus lucknowensis TaxID=176173 RepID=A0ABR4LW79_9EURO
MVNWKLMDNVHRVIAALLAANPGIKLDYHAMAALFGQGATYDSIEGQFRKFRKQADELRAEAEKNGISLAELPRARPVTSTTPRTPRTGRGGITKPSSSTGKGKKGASKVVGTPTKPGSKKVTGENIMEAIFIGDDESEEEEDADIKIKSETEGLVLPSIEQPDFGLPYDSSSRGIKSEGLDVFGRFAKTPSVKRGKSKPAQKDDDGDEQMVSVQDDIRHKREAAPDRSLLDLSISRNDEEDNSGTTDEEVA